MHSILRSSRANHLLPRWVHRDCIHRNSDVQREKRTRGIWTAAERQSRRRWNANPQSYSREFDEPRLPHVWIAASARAVVAVVHECHIFQLALNETWSRQPYFINPTIAVGCERQSRRRCSPRTAARSRPRRGPGRWCMCYVYIDVLNTVCVCVCTYVYIYIHIYTHIDTVYTLV